MMNERIKELGEWDAANRKHIADLTDTPIKKLAVSSGVYDCITDPYDALKNGDQYSSVMPDLVRFAELIVSECASHVDWILAEGGKTQGDLIKQHFGVKE